MQTRANARVARIRTKNNTRARLRPSAAQVDACATTAQNWSVLLNCEIKMSFFTEADRSYLTEMRAITMDGQGREVLVGLSAEETEFYMRYTKSRMKGKATRTMVTSSWRSRINTSWRG